MIKQAVSISSFIMLLGGCHMSSWDGHDCGGNGMCGGGQGTPRDGCGSDLQCSPAEKCGPGGVCVEDAPAECTSNAECAKGTYCDVGQGRCAPSQTCTLEADCPDGFNCDPGRSTCAPAPEPTCGELGTELECVGRGDCVPVYAGVGCSCGVDCTCKGGEPGCVCESFEFFRCDAS